MKKKLIVGAVAVITIIPFIVGASSVWSQSRFALPQGQVREGNVYVAAEETLVAGNVNGDLVMAGASTVMVGGVSEDLFIASGNAHISGTVGGDVRLLAGDSILAGTIKGDLAIIGGKTYIADGSSIGGDLLVLGGEVSVAGSVAGRIHVSGGDITINGPVAGNVEAKGGRLIIGEKAVLGGTLLFRGPQAPFIAPGAVIEGKTEYIADDFGGKHFRSAAQGVSAAVGIVGLLMSTVLALLFFALFRERVRGFVHDGLSAFWPRVGRGLLTMILLPLASIIVMATIIGLPVGAFGLLLFFLGNILAMGLSGAVFGSWFMRVIVKKQEHQPTFASVLWGTVALRAITFIPVVGWAIGLLFCSAAFGVLFRAAYHRFWVNK